MRKGLCKQLECYFLLLYKAGINGLVRFFKKAYEGRAVQTAGALLPIVK